MMDRQGLSGEVIVQRLSGPMDEDQLLDKPGSGRRKLRLLLARVFLIALLIVFWQVASGRWINPFWISSPNAVWERLQEMTFVGDSPLAVLANLPKSDLWFNLQLTLQAMLLGLVSGMLAGMVAGFVLGRARFVGDVLEPILLALYSLPKLALAPLFILWFGIGLTTKIVYSATIVFFLVFLNTYTGAREVDHDLVDTARIFGAGRLEVLRKIVVPSALTWVFAGLRLSVPYSLVGVVVAEMMASNRGMGYLIVSAANQFDTAGVFAALVVLIILAGAVNMIVMRVEAYLLRWKGSG